MTWLIPVVITIYYLPTAIMAWKQHPRTNDMFMFNTLVGWTIIGWVWALCCSLYPNS